MVERLRLVTYVWSWLFALIVAHAATPAQRTTINHICPRKATAPITMATVLINLRFPTATPPLNATPPSFLDHIGGATHVRSVPEKQTFPRKS